MVKRTLEIKLERQRRHAADNLVETNYVRVTEQLHHLYFTKDFLEVVNIQLSFVDDLDRHLVQKTILHNIRQITINTR